MLLFNRPYKYLLKKNIIYQKKVGLQASNSTEHVFIHLISKILDAFNENKYTPGIFIDLSKVSDIVGRDILLKKLDIYGIKEKNVKWFHSYLRNRKQFIKYHDQNINLEAWPCGVALCSKLNHCFFSYL